MKKETQICRSRGKYYQLYGIGFIAAQSLEDPNKDRAYFHGKNRKSDGKGHWFELRYSASSRQGAMAHIAHAKRGEFEVIACDGRISSTL